MSSGPGVEAPALRSRPPTGGSSVADRTSLAVRVAASAAVEVDRVARFPAEAIDELRRQGLLGAAVPPTSGGEGLGLEDLATSARMLAQACPSTGMIFAMHQIQVQCLVRHGETTALQAFLHRVVDEQLLLASATTEAGVGGDVRSSVCAIVHQGDKVTLVKEASVISYGEHADAVLATARRTTDSPASDQVLVVCLPPGLRLDQTTTWDTLGFRGTASYGYRLTASVDEDMVLPAGYGDISGQTMLPVSHILWASVWLGMAEAAGRTAQRKVRSAARKNPGSPSLSTVRLAELSVVIGQLRAQLRAALDLYSSCQGNPDALGSLSFAVTMNNLKVVAATTVVDAVARAMAICGLDGYRQDSDYSLGQLLRDAYGARLMVNTDRVLANNAQLLLGGREL